MKVSAVLLYICISQLPVPVMRLDRSKIHCGNSYPKNSGTKRQMLKQPMLFYWYFLYWSVKLGTIEGLKICSKKFEPKKVKKYSHRVYRTDNWYNIVT